MALTRFACQGTVETQGRSGWTPGAQERALGRWPGGRIRPARTALFCHRCIHIGHEKEETMKRIAIVGCMLVLMAAAFKAGDIVRAERFVVLNDRGKPAFVATVDQAGGGELAVYDALGNETFAVRDGKIIATSLGLTAEIDPSRSEPEPQGESERKFRTFWPPDDLLGQPHDPRTETAESARNRTLWEPEPQTGAAYPVGQGR